MGPKDKSLGDRIVGYYEFGKSLEALVALIQNSTKEEIDVYNQIIAARPEFKIFTNLARGIENPNSTLKLEPLAADDDFSRTGLFWLTSLARIEFATTRSLFHGAESPFLEVAPTHESEQIPYFRMLMDAFKSHYYDTMKSDKIKVITASSRFGPSQPVLAYIRRLALMADMYEALIPVAKKTFTEPQYREFKSMGKDFHQKFSELVRHVSANLDNHDGGVTGQTLDSTVKPIYEACDLKCRRLAQQVGGFK